MSLRGCGKIEREDTKHFEPYFNEVKTIGADFRKIFGFRLPIKKDKESTFAALCLTGFSAAVAVKNFQARWGAVIKSSGADVRKDPLRSRDQYPDSN